MTTDLTTPLVPEARTHFKMTDPEGNVIVGPLQADREDDMSTDQPTNNDYSQLFTTCPDCGGVTERDGRHIDTSTNETVDCPAHCHCNRVQGHGGLCMWT